MLITFKEVIMRIIAAVTLSMAALGLGMPGCTAEHASAIEDSESVQAVTGVADENDPFGSCVLDDTQTEGLFPGTCSSTGGLCDGWSQIGCTDNNELCPYGNFWVRCVHTCEENSDCPVPQTGTAEPRCRGLCELPCDDSTVCPDGFFCADSGLYLGSANFSAGVTEKFCVQYFELESFAVPSFTW